MDTKTDKTLARYLTVGGAAVDITARRGLSVRATCTGCGEADSFIFGALGGMSTDEQIDTALQKMARPWAQDHAERCRAMPIES